MVASDIQRKTDKGSFLAVFLNFLYSVAAVKTDVGALSTLFCATSPDAAAHPGKIWSPGPAVQLKVLKTYDATLRGRTFSAIDAAIKSKGGAGFSA